MAGINQLVYPLTKVADAVSATAVYWTCPPELQGLAIEWTVYVVFNHTSSAGGVTFESSPLRDYAGTWATVGSAMSWSAIDKVSMLNATGLYQALRLRVSTTVSDGAADIYVMGANT